MHELKTRRQIPSPQPEPPVRHEPLGEDKREAQCTRRIGIRIVSFRKTLLDPDNLCVKYLIDGLRYCRVIPDDTAKDIELTVSQEKCAKEDERTEIEINYP
jgi:hypothetical protein